MSRYLGYYTGSREESEETMNMDLSKVAGNNNNGSSSVYSSTNSLCVNGGFKDKSSTNVVNEYKFPPRGIPSLRLPVVSRDIKYDYRISFAQNMSSIVDVRRWDMCGQVKVVVKIECEDDMLEL
ncbi:protein phosphatase 2A, regulatory subunit PR55 [Artemisia annua]|uniref:Protein phosphatase 2A, regulatory subunit PR55 n=1 Tax=Artemisia annua TaxID=35608 RepID=A0A2U1NV75_ARTAN|nr:protein phosphatase 2A, regulatory subunit PR55 [Artemisia annua]